MVGGSVMKPQLTDEDGNAAKMKSPSPERRSTTITSRGITPTGTWKILGTCWIGDFKHKSARGWIVNENIPNLRVSLLIDFPQLSQVLRISDGAAKVIPLSRVILSRFILAKGKCLRNVLSF